MELIELLHRRKQLETQANETLKEYNKINRIIDYIDQLIQKKI